MANPRPPASGKPGRHLSAVPDLVQPPLWDSDEMSRLAYLRSFAINSGQPAETVELIESAATAEEALDLLERAGLLPSDEEGLDAMLTWFAPVLEAGADQLAAELAGSAFIGTFRRMPPPLADEADVQAMLAELIDQVEAKPGRAGLAMLRSLSVVGPAELRARAAKAAAEMVEAGQADFAWSAGLGTPEFVQSFGYEDIYGEQRSLVLIFQYGTARHALVVLIDYVLGGGIKDCWVTEDVKGLRSEYRKVAAGEPDAEFSDLDAAQARAILDVALACKPCPVEPDQIEGVEDNLELLRARVALLPEPATAGKPAAATAAPAGTKERKAGTSQRPRTIHRLKVTLRSTKPPIWRRLEVPSDITLALLHDAIQVSFDWMDQHLHVFETPAGDYGSPGPDVRSDARKKLSDVARWPGEKIRYEYDLSDSWIHEIAVEAVEPAEAGVAYPRCTAGKRATPPEDCGGPWRYSEMREALADPLHEEHEYFLEWLGLSSAEEFDPDHFDRVAVNGELSRCAAVLRKKP